jgi:hypothetical protein
MARILKVAGVCAIIGAIVLLVVKWMTGYPFGSAARLAGDTLGAAFAIFVISTAVGGFVYFIRRGSPTAMAGVGTTVAVSCLFTFAATWGATH